MPTAIIDLDSLKRTAIDDVIDRMMALGWPQPQCIYNKDFECIGAGWGNDPDVLAAVLYHDAMIAGWSEELYAVYRGEIRPRYQTLSVDGMIEFLVASRDAEPARIKPHGPTIRL